MFRYLVILGGFIVLAVIGHLLPIRPPMVAELNTTVSAVRAAPERAFRVRPEPWSGVSPPQR